MNALDLVAILAVCTTTIICFVIRAGRGSDVDELEEELSGLATEIGKTKGTVTNLHEVVTSNAKEFAIFRADVRTRMNLGPK